MDRDRNSNTGRQEEDYRLTEIVLYRDRGGNRERKIKKKKTKRIWRQR